MSGYWEVVEYSLSGLAGSDIAQLRPSVVTRHLLVARSHYDAQFSSEQKAI